MEAVRPSRLLEDEHRRIDRGLEGILDGSAQAADLIESLALLRRHVYLEHEILFPPLAKAGLVMPIWVMKREHAQMWPLIDPLISACEAGSPVQALGASCRELLRLLQAHNPKEEQLLYTAADRIDAEGAGELAKALEAARMPEGWTCPPSPR